MITYEQLWHNEEIKTYIKKADEALAALGYTEHSFAHVGLVSAQASAILKPATSLQKWERMPTRLNWQKSRRTSTILAIW
mgnify:CR=1 FL=1